MKPSAAVLIVACATGVACAETPPDTVRPGIDVLLTDSAHLVEDARVGLLTNQTGVTRSGVGDIDAMVAAGIRLTALFSPEHGFRGTLDQPNVEHGMDSATGLPIYSLYGAVRAPTPAMLEQVDVIVIDLQDIGARTYTYISTALLAMRAARDAGRRVIVLDRPNPIGGQLVQGPVRAPGHDTFVGMLPVALRHGMTFAEMARLGNDVLDIGADLTVVPASGWRRDQWFDATGLPWVRPSPNMPSLESATHYPGTVLFEATGLSVGRGTPIAFQVVGAPWLAVGAVLERVGEFPGVELSDTTVVPTDASDGKYDRTAIRAVRFRTIDRTLYDPTQVAVALLGAIAERHPDSVGIRAASLDRLAGTDALRIDVASGPSGASLWADWGAGLAAFGRLRDSYLLYP